MQREPPRTLLGEYPLRWLEKIKDILQMVVLLWFTLESNKKHIKQPKVIIYQNLKTISMVYKHLPSSAPFQGIVF